MKFEELIERIKTGEYDPTVSGSTVEFYCLTEDYGISPEPRDPDDAVAAGAKNPTYGSVLAEEETAFADRSTVRRAMGAGWLLTNPIPTAIRSPEDERSPVPVTQVEDDHVTDYRNHRGVDQRFGIDPDRAIWAVNTRWVVDVPDGYSVLYAHPFNYASEEFTTLPGIVDADRFPHRLTVPVAVDVDRGSVRFDDPLVQIVPFERSDGPIEASVDTFEGERPPASGASEEVRSDP